MELVESNLGVHLGNPGEGRESPFHAVTELSDFVGLTLLGVTLSVPLVSPQVVREVVRVGP